MNRWRGGRGCVSEYESEETWSASGNDANVYGEKQNASGSESVTSTLTACDAVHKSSVSSTATVLS